MANQEKDLPLPSEEFWEAVIHSGSSVVDCGLCGRTHFAAAPRCDFEEGEYERLMKQHEKNPDRFVYHSDVDGISWGTLDGVQAVYGCPCNKVSKYEQFIWSNRYIIADYLVARTAKELKDARKESELAKKVKVSVEASK